MTHFLPKGEGRRCAVQRLSNMGQDMQWSLHGVRNEFWMVRGGGGKKKSGLLEWNNGIDGNIVSILGQVRSWFSHCKWLLMILSLPAHFPPYNEGMKFHRIPCNASYE